MTPHSVPRSLEHFEPAPKTPNQHSDSVALQAVVQGAEMTWGPRIGGFDAGVNADRGFTRQYPSVWRLVMKQVVVLIYPPKGLRVLSPGSLGRGWCVAATGRRWPWMRPCQSSRGRDRISLRRKRLPPSLTMSCRRPRLLKRDVCARFASLALIPRPHSQSTLPWMPPRIASASGRGSL